MLFAMNLFVIGNVQNLNVQSLNANWSVKIQLVNQKLKIVATVKEVKQEAILLSSSRKQNRIRLAVIAIDSLL